MAKKKLALSVDDPVVYDLVEPPLTVEEPRPHLVLERAGAPEESLAVLKFLGGENGFSLHSPGTLTYRTRLLKGTGKFKMQFRGVTMWIDDSSPEAVVTYLHNATASELTVECNDDFAIIANFRSGDLGIQVPREPSKRRKYALINRGEADETFGALG